MVVKNLAKFFARGYFLARPVPDN